MRKLTAPYILSPDGQLLEKYTLVSDQGVIIDLVKGEKSDAEHVDGILCPGFINTHCHLELSHLHEKITPGKGLAGFIKEFVAARKTYTHGVDDSIWKADEYMWNNGIQGAGDICNARDTFKCKRKSSIRYHSFIELFSMLPHMAEEVIGEGNLLYEEALSSHGRASIVPHAAYSVPKKLFKLIKGHCELNNRVWSVHNQETESENQLFVNGKGALADAFVEMGIDRSWFSPTGLSSIESIGEYIPAGVHVLLVHNTFTAQDDLNFLDSEKLLKRTWFAICPNANLFIESRLPDVKLLMKNKCNITLGTDSLASNSSLSILEEIKAIHNIYTDIPMADLLSWATINGARFFGWDDFGEFKKGTEPGILQITDCGKDFILPQSKVVRIS